ncbi:MAG TPA: ABC transporter ATP-binding protein [Steroidobacteraceae bacterium]|nr:ABC transporter ATP-binding protein [Steroidobacteraceae bacterium]
MSTVIDARGLAKHYGAVRALDGTSFRVDAGRIVGLIGRNGAGKTTALKAILGLTQCGGELRVLDMDPRSQRDALMQQVCFIADTAVLPRWLRVDCAVDFMAGLHPRFKRERALEFLARTTIRATSRIGELSKGMVTQLHLALILAIDARLLVLDEPTLGLDLLYRRQFYDTLLNDYFDHDRTILLTTHQVEEVENLLTDVLFIDQGRIVLDSTVEELGTRFAQLQVAPAQLAAARALGPMHERELMGRYVLLFENRERAALEPLGEVGTPSVADLFVARVQGAAS